MVAASLVKDQKKRPSSEKLLKHPFFKHAKTTDYLERTIVDGHSPLGDRFRMLKQEYIRGISTWKFNLEDLKNQINDLDEVSNVEDPKTTEQQKGVNGVTLLSEKLSPKIDNNNTNNNINNNNNNSNAKTGDEIPILENSLVSFPVELLQALEGYFDACEDNVATVSPTGQDENPIFKRSIFDSGPRFRGREPFLSHPSELRQILIEVMDRPSTESDHSGHDPRIEDFTQATTENVPETRAHVIAELDLKRTRISM